MDVVSACCDTTSLTALREESIAVWGRVFPYAYPTVPAKRTLLSSLTNSDSTSTHTPTVAAVLLSAALLAISQSRGAMEIMAPAVVSHEGVTHAEDTEGV
jgi:hypothetical protein